MPQTPLNPQQYKDPANGTPSTIGTQLNTHYLLKQALIELKKEQYFSQLADTTTMPKHYGKTIKQHVYLPLLDDGNINDQGIDASGVTISSSGYTVTLPGLVTKYVVEADATAAAAAINAVATGVATKSGAATPWTVTASKTNLGTTTETLATAVADAVPGTRVVQGSGNIYGSSKDVGTITSKLPALGENGGRVNRVGFTRRVIEGSLEKFGFFQEYTQESVDFDTDAELMSHVNREMLNGANEITEDALQIDLLNSAGVIKYTGAATSTDTVADTSVLTYKDVLNLSIDLDNNRTPKHTKIITGSRMVDTRVLNSARILYAGSELRPTFKAMKDLHQNPAFISVEHYASAGNTVTGEIGAIDQFRIVEVPEMLKWEGAGDDASSNTTHHQTGGKFDVFPLLCVGDASFTTIGFQTDGKSVKFKIINRKPGEATADRSDPYGETGFMSIKWYYGFMVQRPERIGLIKTAAVM
jgi:N4-gp56 family major capsid protein